ncbi:MULTISPECIES: ABC transporter ATP-binding protein [Kytococcus]|uniref:ABC transporter ATP-binding protein n=1 Tax=Kytococcus schroeteri TaxID=138300 RepID=A0A2I1PAP8_9MICO|nr:MULTISPECIES: ABC transporter ATP-binding protein [Kytococcus]OFS16008.1 multidrug ABC transporter ATP-binding protein [Kytococcus sp. HMSC28H12]PKZ41697.1 ABC transporter ATP-binding protein [Kytococcus schroeteri]
MHAISALGLSKAFRGTPVLRDVDLTVEHGESIGLSGPNGSGKSVLFKLLVGFMRPDAGEVTIDPALMGPGRKYPESFGVMINSPGFLGHLSAADNLRELAHIRRVADEARVRETLEAVGLDPTSSTKAKNFSLGMKQKLGIAQAILERPRVLLLDEPFNALDQSSAERITGLLRDFSSDGGTLLMTSHRSEDLEALTQRRLRIDDARVVEA